jgi:hypothetical protein
MIHRALAVRRWLAVEAIANVAHAPIVAFHGFANQALRNHVQLAGAGPSAAHGARRELVHASTIASRIRSAKNLPFDLNETIQIAPIDVGDDEYYREGVSRGMFPPNRWPECLPEFKEVYVEYFQRMTKLAGDLMRLSALALDLPENYFVDKIDRPVSKLAARLYPEQTQAPLPGQLRAAAHTDYGTVTILKPGNAPGGLQVSDRDGAWGTTCRTCRTHLSST